VKTFIIIYTDIAVHLIISNTPLAVIT